jgi:hypothetical protein
MFNSILFDAPGLKALSLQLNEDLSMNVSIKSKTFVPTDSQEELEEHLWMSMETLNSTFKHRKIKVYAFPPDTTSHIDSAPEDEDAATPAGGRRRLATVVRSGYYCNSYIGWGYYRGGNADGCLNYYTSETSSWIIARPHYKYSFNYVMYSGYWCYPCSESWEPAHGYHRNTGWTTYVRSCSDVKATITRVATS